MKLLKLLAVFLAVAVIIFSCKKENDSISNVLNTADSNFIVKASIGNYSEIKTAKVAVSNATDSIVLAFAQSMLTEHTKAHSDLKTMGTIVGFTVKDTTDAAHEAIINQLNSLTGRSFDSVYIHSQVTDHLATMDFYKDELNNGRQVNVKNYANYYLQNFTTDYQTADSIAVDFF